MTLNLRGPIALRGDVPLGDRCGIDRALGVVGNRTAILLLREAFYGATRFDALTKRVGVTEAVASQRLRELVAAGVLEKQPYREPGQRTRYEYVLTSAGHELLPTLLSLLEWGSLHVPTDHRGLEVRCAADHLVAEDEIVIRSRN
jgi:DNA-binding HxlR family transcriptional regulator